MMKIAIGGSVLAAIFCWNSALSQAPQWLTIGKNAFAFHEEKLQDYNVKMEPPFSADAEIFIEQIGLPNVSKINQLRLQIRRTYGLKTAVALEGEGFRTIAFDPDWAASDTPKFYLILGHEAGHHFCGHSVGAVRGNRTQIELEADQFGGASIKRYEVYHNRSFFNQVFAAAVANYPEQAQFSYPPRKMRLDALKRGYEQGSQCGGLAPVEQSGFSPGTRSNRPATPCRPVRTGPTSYACE
jgi:hypothetical protein